MDAKEFNQVGAWMSGVVRPADWGWEGPGTGGSYRRPWCRTPRPRQNLRRSQDAPMEAARSGTRQPCGCPHERPLRDNRTANLSPLLQDEVEGIWVADEVFLMHNLLCPTWHF